jgi:hypothetical protein
MQLIRIVGLHRRSSGCIVLSVGCWGCYCAAVFACCCVSFNAFTQHSYQTNSELKHGHNKVDVPPERRRFGTGKACTTAKLSRTFNVKLLWMLKGRESPRHFLGYAWEIYDQWRLEKCRGRCRFCQSYEWRRCSDGAVELMFCCWSCDEARVVRWQIGWNLFGAIAVFRDLRT